MVKWHNKIWEMDYKIIIIIIMIELWIIISNHNNLFMKILIILPIGR
jgi:hypothetical protein